MPVGLWPLFVALGLFFLALRFVLPNPAATTVSVILSIVSFGVAVLVSIPLVS